MKKVILFFVCFTALTIFNFIKIENKAELKTSLSSLILAAKADGEGGGPCYDQLYSWEIIGGGCDYMFVERFECEEGDEVTICYRGVETTNYYCSGPPVWNDYTTVLSCS